MFSAMDICDPKDAVELVAVLEGLGYERFWTTEHHGTGFQSASPTLLAGILAGRTSRIRVGTAAVLLSLYSPLKVLEDFRLLELVFPGRVDLGVASGLPAQPYLDALADGRTSIGGEEYLGKVEELAAFTRGQEVHDIDPKSVGPYSGRECPLWLCGLSIGSAKFAGRLGIAFSYHHHLGGNRDGSAITRAYVEAFEPSPQLEAPRFNVACYGVCAKNTEAATQRWQRYVASTKLLPDSSEIPPVSFLGGPDECAAQLRTIRELYRTDELVLQSLAPEYEARVESHMMLDTVRHKV